MARVGSDPAVVRAEPAPARCNLEAEIVRGPMGGGYGDALQVERAGPGGVDPADARTAASEPGGLDQGPVGFGELIRAKHTAIAVQPADAIAVYAGGEDEEEAPE